MTPFVSAGMPGIPLVAASDVLGWGNTAFALGSTLIGLFIGIKAYQGYRRHESRSMQYLSIGLFMLTAVAYTAAFGGSLLLRQGIIADRYEVLITLVARAFQFAGLAFIAYSLHSRRDR